MGGVNNQNRRGVYCRQCLDSHVGLLRKNLILLVDVSRLFFILLETVLLNKGSIDGRLNFRLRNGGDSLSGHIVESISFDLPLHKISFSLEN